MIAPASQKNLLTFGGDSVSDMDSGSLPLSAPLISTTHPNESNESPASIRNSLLLPTFRRHLKHCIFSLPILTPNDHPLLTRPDSL